MNALTDKTKRKIEDMIDQAASTVAICVWEQISDATKDSVDDSNFQPIVRNNLLAPGFRFNQAIRQPIRLKLDEYDFK